MDELTTGISVDQVTTRTADEIVASPVITQFTCNMDVLRDVAAKLTATYG